MSTADFNTTEIELFSAQGALDEFNGSVSRTDLIARVQSARPLHPALMVARAASTAAGLTLIATLIWTGMVASGTLPTALVAFAEPAGVPAPLIGLALALCCGAIMACARELAVMAGEHSPMLPNEAKVHQRLVSDVLRLKAMRTVRARVGKKD